MIHKNRRVQNWGRESLPYLLGLGRQILYQNGLPKKVVVRCQERIDAAFQVEEVLGSQNHLNISGQTFPRTIICISELH